MPPLTLRFLRTAAGFLLIGIALGLWLLIGRELRGVWPARHLVSAHAHLLLVGSVLSTILGTALWLFPRPVSTDHRVRAWHGEAAYWCITVGTVARTAGEIARASSGASMWRWIAVIGGSLQLTGLAFGLLALRARVRASVSPRSAPPSSPPQL
ncbi:MAG: hypothetical protein ABIR59_12745 [Gemmatimonadales bacterium]